MWITMFCFCLFKQSGRLLGHDYEGMPDTIADGLRASLGDVSWPVVRYNSRPFLPPSMTHADLVYVSHAVRCSH